MAVAAKYLGLCTTCRNDPTCTFPRTSSRPVVHCEEFVMYELPPPRGSGVETSEATGREEVLRAMALARELGLCSNCENRKTCTFPNARNAVSACEEYQ